MKPPSGTSRLPDIDNPNPVAELHNAVAASPNPAEASTRPQGTLAIELKLMTRYVVRRLRLSPATSVLEIGCGTGIFSEPIAKAGASYLGVDFAQRPIEILRERAAASPFGTRIDAHHLDPLAQPQAMEALGSFDRALMYATLHYARSEAEGRDLVRLVIDRLRPGGRALIGSLPLQELRWELQPQARPVVVRARLLLKGEREPLPTPPLWRLGCALAVTAKRIPSHWGRGAVPPPSLPAGYAITLSRSMIEGWLPDTVRYRWRRGAAGAPLSFGRADLLITRDD